MPQTFTTEFTTWLDEQMGFQDASEFSDTQVAKLQAKFDAEKAAKLTTGPQTVDDVIAARAKEDQRQSKIAQLTDGALEDYPGKASEIEAIARLAVTQRWGPEKFELEVLRAGRPQAGQFKTRSGKNATVDAKVIEAALCMTAGLPNIEKAFRAEVLQAVDDAGLRHMGLQQALLMAASQNGMTTRPGDRIHAGNFTEVLEYAMPPRIVARAAGFSSMSMPGILGAVANKEVMAGYGEEIDPAWKEIAEIKTSTNFLPYNCYRMNDDLEFEPLAPTGEIRHGKLTQESYTRKVGTQAKMLGLPREAIVNDDTGVFDTIRKLLGIGGYRRFKNLFWKTFIDNIATMFTSGRGNYISGTTTNLGSDGVGLQALELKFRQMKTSAADGAKRITGRASILLHPPEVSVNARNLYTAANINTGGASTKDSVANANVFQGLYRPVTVDELSDTSVSAAASQTGFGLFRDKGILAPMVVSYLNGNPNPVIESADADFSYMGIQFRGVFDVGADPAEWLAGCWSKGAN